jgi:hypothetical protein
MGKRGRDFRVTLGGAWVEGTWQGVDDQGLGVTREGRGLSDDRQRLMMVTERVGNLGAMLVRL